MKISFWGSSNFSKEILMELHKKSKVQLLELAFVVTQSAKPFGRKKELKNNPVAEYCLENKITLLTQKKDTFFEYGSEKTVPLSRLHTDISVVAAYGKIISKNVLETAKYGFINFHGSLLPKYRGAVPVQMSIMNQDNEAAGLTVIKMNEGMDTGEIIISYKISILDSMTSEDLMNELAKRSVKALDEDFDTIFSPENWKLEKQDETEATTCFLRDFEKKDLELNYLDGVKLAHGKIMAGNPEPKAWIDTEALNLRLPFLKMNILRSKAAPVNQDNQIGTLPYWHIETFTPNNRLSFHIDKTQKKLYLELSDGLLELLEIQPEGKNIMDVRSFLNGYGQLVS